MYHIIVNPESGKRLAKKNFAVLCRVLEESGAEYRVHETSRPLEAALIAAELTGNEYRGYPEGVRAHVSDPVREADRLCPPTKLSEKIAIAPASASDGETADGAAEETEIIVVGGDGTLHETLNGLADPTKTRLGLIPSGTGNDFAVAAKIPFDAEEAAKLILAGKPKETDYLDVGGVRCMNIGGMGMDVDVLVRCRRGRIRGKIKYLLSLLQSLFSFKGCTIETENGEIREKRSALLAVACNGTQIGGGIRVCPASAVDDGKMDVVLVDCIGVIGIIKAFGKLMKGKILDDPAARHFLCERVRIVPDSPCTVQLDGELYDGLDFDARLMRGLKIYR